MKSHKNIFSCNAGASLVLVGVVIALLAVVVVVVVDTSRLFAVKNRAQNALDAALLGAISTISTTNKDEEAQRIFDANYPTHYLESTPSDLRCDKAQVSCGIQITSDVVLSTNENGDEVRKTVYTATLHVNVPTLAIDVLSGDLKNVTVTSQVTLSSDNEHMPDLELALVVDNSGSMQETDEAGIKKIDALKQASKDLVCILFGDKCVGGEPTIGDPKIHDTSDKIRISVVPFDVAVKIGTEHRDWMQSFSPVTMNYHGLVQLSDGRDLTVLANIFINSLLRSSRNKYDQYVAGTVVQNFTTPVGLATNRRADYLCGVYPMLAVGALCDPTCNPDDTVVTCNSETGVCVTTHRDCSCQPDHGGEVYISSWFYNCTSGYVGFLNNFTNLVYTPVQGVASIDLDDVNDEPPTSGEKWKFRIPYENWSPQAIYGNMETPFPWGPTPDGQPDPGHATATYLAPLLFASNSKQELFDEFEKFNISGGTRLNVGLMWGWFTLSTKWRGLWDPGKPTLPSTSTPDKPLDKAIVLMTDGKNIYVQGAPDYNGIHDDNVQTAAMCTKIKSQGITIYTVGLGKKENLNEDVLIQCATQTNYYFYAPDADALRKVFRAIADTINASKLQLSQ